MTDSIEIYVQPGTYGLHAGGRYPCRAYAAHKDDEETAAWRCALKHWFPSRPNGVLLYREARAITIDRIGEHEFKATLTVDDEHARKMQFAREFTPSLPLVEDAGKASAAKTRATSVVRRGVRGSAPASRRSVKPRRKARKK